MKKSTPLDIAVIGLACRFPQSPDAETYWSNLKEARNCVSKSRLGNQYAGFIERIDTFDHDFFNITPFDARMMDPRQRLFLETAWHALEDGGYAGDQWVGSRTGVFVGAGNNQYAQRLNAVQTKKSKAIDHANASIANRFSYFMDFRGPSLTVDSICSSSTLAIHQACYSIRNEECDQAIAGGVHLLLSQHAVQSLQSMMFISDSHKNSSFSREVNGFIPSEGVGAVLLKPLETALEDRDHIYAVIKASSVNYAGRTKNLLSPNPCAQTRLMVETCQKFDISPCSLQYLEMNGGSTVTGDYQEVQSTLDAFKILEVPEQFRCPFGTVKNNVGNLDPASGIAAFIKLLLSFKHGIIPPLINHQPLNRFIKLEKTSLYLADKAIPLRQKSFPTRMGLNSFSVGGTNLFMILEQVENKQTRHETKFDHSQEAQVLLISGKGKSNLKKNLTDLLERLKTDHKANLEDIRYTYHRGRAHFSHRAGLIYSNREELIQQIEQEVKEIDLLPQGRHTGDMKRSVKPQKSGLKDFFRNAGRRNQRPSSLLQESDFIAEFYPEKRKIIVVLPVNGEKKDEINIQGLVKSLRQNNSVFNHIYEKLYRKNSGQAEQWVLFFLAYAESLISYGVKLLELAFHNASQLASFEELHHKNRNIKLVLYPEFEKIDDQNHLLVPIPGGDRKDGILVTISHLYQSGVFLDWEQLEKGRAGQKMPMLPQYNFTKNSFWLEEKATSQAQEEEKSQSLAVIGSTIKRERDVSFQENTKEQLTRALTSFFEEKLVTHYEISQQIDPALPLSTYGVDSLFFLSTLSDLRDKTGINFENASLFSFSCLNEMTDHLIAKHFNSLCKSFFPGIILEEIEDPSRSSEVAQSEALPTDQASVEGIAIVAMSARFPGAPTLDIFWENLCDGQSGIREIPKDRWDVASHFDPTPQMPGKSCSKWAGIIDDMDTFDPFFFDIHPKEAQSMDPQQRLMLQEVWHAMERGGLTKEQLENRKVGVFIGSSNFEYSVKLANKPLEKIVAHDSLGTSHSVIANRVSHFLKLTGPSFALDATCSSSMVALHLACQSIQSGECEMAIVGGVNLALNLATFVSVSKTNILSPTGHCRIFDDQSNGAVRGEGVGVVILKALPAAEKDRNQIEAVIQGTAVRYKGQSMAIMLPSTQSIKKVMETAWKKAGLRPHQMSYFEVGSFGSKISDPIEFTALKTAFSENSPGHYSCFLGSVKPNIGHLEAVSGIAGLIKAVLVLKNKKIPPMLHSGKINPTIKLEESGFQLNHSIQSIDGPPDAPLYAGINSLGFGGTLAHTVIASYMPHITIPVKELPGACCLSAKSLPALVKKLKDLIHWIQTHEEASIHDISYTLNIRRSHFSQYRCAFAYSDREEFMSLLGQKIKSWQRKKISLKKRKKRPISPKPLLFISAEGKKEEALLALIKRCEEAKINPPLILTTEAQIEDSLRGENLASRHEQIELDLNQPTAFVFATLIAELFEKNHPLNLESLYQTLPVNHLDLPVYPFEKTSYWLDK